MNTQSITTWISVTKNLYCWRTLLFQIVEWSFDTDERIDRVSASGMCVAGPSTTSTSTSTTSTTSALGGFAEVFTTDAPGGPVVPQDIIDQYGVTSVEYAGDGCYEIRFNGPVQTLSEGLLGFEVDLRVRNSGWNIEDGKELKMDYRNLGDEENVEVIVKVSLADRAGDPGAPDPGTVVTEWLEPDLLQFKVTGIEVFDGDFLATVDVPQTDGPPHRLTFP